MEVRQSGGIRRIVKRLERGRDLFVESNELDQYRGFVIAQIDAKQDIVEFTNGHVLNAGDATGDITEITIRRIQIREAIRAYLEKEQVLFVQGIKVLTLFFIDEVVKYRDYSCMLKHSDNTMLINEQNATIIVERLSYDNIAETKGSMSSMEIRPIEQTKIECARKFFAEINCKIDTEHVKYDVVTSYGKLMDIVGMGEVSG